MVDIKVYEYQKTLLDKVIKDSNSLLIGYPDAIGYLLNEYFEKRGKNVSDVYDGITGALPTNIKVKDATPH